MYSLIRLHIDVCYQRRTQGKGKVRENSSVELVIGKMNDV